MKKTLLSLFIGITAIAAGTKLQAQTRPSFGIRGGVNFANLNNVDNTDARTGFQAGLYAGFPIQNSPVVIQPEVLYTQKGAKEDVEGVEIKDKLDYIEIPVLAKFNFVNNGAITPNVYFGPYIAFNVNAKAEGSSGNTSASVDISDNVKTTDFGVTVGAGLDFDHFNIGVRYDAGLVKVAEDGSDGKNGVFSIVAGIGF